MNDDKYTNINFRKFNNSKCSGIRKRKQLNDNSSDSELEIQLSNSLDIKNKQKDKTNVINKKNNFFTVRLIL